MSKPKKYIDVEQIIASKNENLARWLPGFAKNYIKRIVHENDVNRVMQVAGHLYGLDFVHAVLKELNTSVVLKGGENIPEKGGVILASNHPLGGLDGIMLMEAVSRVRTDMKFLVNDILMNIKNLEPLFLPVNKHGANARGALNLIDKAYASDEVTLVFPAGLVSRNLDGEIKDLKWRKSFIAKSIQYKKDIIPVHVNGRNSNFFYNLSKFRTKLGVKANLEMFYLADEFFKQRGKTITVRIGKPIPYQTFDNSKTQNQWAAEVRKKVYELPQAMN